MAALSDIPGGEEVADSFWLDLDRFLTCEGGVTDRDEAIRLLCVLHAVVSYSGVTAFPEVAADCFCDARPSPAHFINEGGSLRFIIQATVDRLAEAIPQPEGTR